MIFLVLLGAEFFNSFIALTQLPVLLASFVTEGGFSPLVVVAAILVLYLLLGCLMDSMAMILLTIPVFFPLIMTLEFGMSAEETAIWFGILTLIVVEVGLITPPVGLNVFIINKMAGDVKISDTFRGVVPFLLSDVLRVILLFSFPRNFPVFDPIVPLSLGRGKAAVQPGRHCLIQACGSDRTIGKLEGIEHRQLRRARADTVVQADQPTCVA